MCALFFLLSSSEIYAIVDTIVSTRYYKLFMYYFIVLIYKMKKWFT